jgi:hypothetical protein
MIKVLETHEPVLLFGGPYSNLQATQALLARLTDDAFRDGFAYFGRIEALTHRLQDIVGRPVDVVVAPARKDRLRRVIEKEAARAF